MRANTAAPVVLGPSPPAAHNHLSAHCRQLASHTPPMPAIAALPPPRPDVVLPTPDVTQVKPSSTFQQRKQPQPRTTEASDSRKSSADLTTPSPLTPSSKSHTKNSLNKTPSTCEGCSRPHDGSYGSGRFCSVHCARRIAASRKWEKQRSQRKRTAAAAAATATAAVDHSTSSMSSASSEDHATQKRQRVVVMQGMIPAHHVVHNSNLVHPQPQQFRRSLPFSDIRPHPYSAAASPLSGTPTPPPSSQHHAFTSYGDYSAATPRALTPVQYHGGYYPYHASPVTYTPTPPPYAMYPSPSPNHLTPPPPPTPTREVLNRTGAPATASYITNLQPTAPPKRNVRQQGLVSSERECEAVAEALLCLRTSSNSG